MNLSSRDREILEILIADYIASAQPVGSCAIARRYSGHLSPASIRNVMADLEEQGLLWQPHTSAGRVPTERALRYYVDCILKVRELSEDDRQRIRERYQGSEDNIERMLKRTSKVLSAISSYAGIVTCPRAEQTVFRHIEFIRLSRNRLLGIFVAQSGMVQNSIIECDHDFTFRELERINNYCASAFVGLSLADARHKAAQELVHEQDQYDRLLRRAMLLSQELLEDVADGELMVDGERQIMTSPELPELETLKIMLGALDEKRQIVKLLDDCQGSEGVNIFIGSESGLPIAGTSLITAPYRQGGNIIGTLGVIGPTRMNYSQVIPVVDFTAKLVGDLIDA